VNIDTNQISQIFGLITSELSKGIDIAKPITNEYIHQYCTRELMFGITFHIIAFTVVGLVILGWRLIIKTGERRDNSLETLMPACTIFSIGLIAIAMILLCNGIDHIGNYIAPLPALIGK